MSKRMALTNLIGGIGLTMVLGVGHAVDDPNAAEDPNAVDESTAELVRAEGTVEVNGEEKLVGTPLNEGDSVEVAVGGTAVVEFRSGCRYTVEGGVKDYTVSEEQCICYENLDSSKHSKHDAVAELARIEGGVMVSNDQGGSYIDGAEGMELKEDDYVMALENSSATVEYYFGCDYTVSDTEVYTVDDGSGCCAALFLPAAAVPLVAPSLLPLGVLGGIPFLPDDDDSTTPTTPPPTPISE